MKISKALGLGLFLHVALIAALIVQPGCQSMEEPTQTYQQSEISEPIGSDGSTSGKLIPARHTDSTLDSAFNSGLDSGGRFEPTRPEREFSEFDGMTPKLSPILSDSPSATVEVAGPSFKLYTVQRGDSLWGISKRENVSLDDLYAANSLDKNSVLKVGQQIKVPVEGSAATFNTITADAYQPSGFNAKTETYVVARGDTLTKIARKFNTSVKIIKAANKKDSDKILVGEKLIIPVDGSRSTGSYRESSQPSSSASTVNPGVHVVKAGEYPATIARKYGITTSELLAINNITEPRQIQPGQTLKVDPKSSYSAPRSKVPPSASVIPTATAKPAVPPKVSTTVLSKPVSNSGSANPVKIRVVEADPIIESNVEDVEVDVFEAFENEAEIPVVPLEAE